MVGVGGYYALHERATIIHGSYTFVFHTFKVGANHGAYTAHDLDILCTYLQ